MVYAIHKTELRKEAPVHLIEIYKFWKIVEETDSNGGPRSTLTDFQNALLELYREDQILADDQMDRFSVMQSVQNTDRSSSDFDLCSDRFVREFPSYEFDRTCRVFPSSKTPTSNFNSLKDYLLSTNLSAMKDFKEEIRFLDGQVNLDGERVAC